MQGSVLSLACVLAMSGCYASNTVEGSASGSRLRAIILTPESGEPAFVGWHDSELDTSCRFQESADGRIRCEPDAPYVYVTALYLDEGCTQRVHEVGAGCAIPAYVRLVEFPPVCPMPAVPSPRLVLLAVGEPVEATRVFEREASGTGDCVPLDRAPEPLHRLTPPDPESFVAAEVREGTGARLVRDQLIGEDGASQPYGLRDTRRGERCDIDGVLLGHSAPGRVPCLPENASTTIVGGALCDETWAIQARGRECLPAPELASFTPLDECGRPGAVEVFVVGAPVPEDERDLGEACATGLDLPLFTTEPAADDAVPWLILERHGSGRIQRAAWTQGDVQVGAFFHDTELDVSCRGPWSTIDGSLRCLPDGARRLAEGRLRVFVDEACTVQGTATTECDSGWMLSWTATTPECAASPRNRVTAAHRIGAPAGRGYHLNESGGCVPRGDTDPPVHHLESVPLTAFARLELRID